MEESPRTRRRTFLRAAVLLAATSLAGCLAWRNACPGPLQVEPLLPDASRLVVDDDLELARRHAPFVYHSFHCTRGRQDVPAPVDFDGNLRGDDAWENYARHELLPTVYYAVLETETHVFLTYHLFHPRDWTRFDLGLHLTHENDGENLQVVVDKATDRVVLLFVQAHYRGGVHAREGAGFADGEERLRGPLTLVDGEGRPSPDGAHPAVYVQSGGHGIYGVPDRHAHVEIDPDGRARFGGCGWVLRPAAPGEPVREPPLVSGSVHPYRLESTTAKLWPPLARSELTGEGRLLDGAVPYADARVVVDVPRYYEGDRFSGPFGPDRGISPFAVDFGFRAGGLGALFFDPARRYAERIGVPAPWSLEYVDYPFRR